MRFYLTDQGIDTKIKLFQKKKKNVGNKK